MTRPIRFRAWDRHNKVWLGPYSLKQLADDDQFNYDTEVKPVCGKYDDFEWAQFTGLLDKNGKEIWEGDIVEFEEMKGKWITVRKEVKWSDEVAGFFPNFSGIYVKVIGNIYEHGDLITNKT